MKIPGSSPNLTNSWSSPKLILFTSNVDNQPVYLSAKLLFRDFPFVSIHWPRKLLRGARNWQHTIQFMHKIARPPHSNWLSQSIRPEVFEVLQLGNKLELTQKQRSHLVSAKFDHKLTYHIPYSALRCETRDTMKDISLSNKTYLPVKVLPLTGKKFQG